MIDDVESPTNSWRHSVNLRQNSMFNAKGELKKSPSARFPLSERFNEEPSKPSEWNMGDPRNGPSRWGQFRDKCGAFVNSSAVTAAMTLLIIVNAILMGVMTFDFVKDDPVLESKLEYFDLSILVVFTVEFTLQATYLGRATIKNPWLVFDGLIALSSWALMGSPIKILRSFRIFRIFALISRLEALKGLFEAVVASLPKMGSISLILTMFFYVFAVLYTNLYADLYDEGFLDWDYFGRLDRTLITLFQFMTLDSWTGVVRQVMLDADPLSFLGFFFFVMVSAFVILSLVIAVVCESMIQLKADDAKKEPNQHDEPQEQRRRSSSATDEVVQQQLLLMSNSNEVMRQTVKSVTQELKKTQVDIKDSLCAVKEDVAAKQLEMQKTLEAILLKVS